jgi:anti-sigma B factor antagonist
MEHQAYVVLAGELDGSTAPFLARTLVDVYADVQGDVVLDIRQLLFIDSTGLSTFVSQHKRQQARGYRLVIDHPTEMARRLFDITGLAQVLIIEPPQPSE